MRNCILKGTWFDTSIRQGDIVNVLGLDEEVNKDWVIDDMNGLLVVNPDVLISGTSIVSTLFCMRKAVLNERFKVCIASFYNGKGFLFPKILLKHIFCFFQGQEGSSRSMLIGTLVHELLQESLRNGLRSQKEVQQQLETCLQQSYTLKSLMGLTMSQDEIRKEVEPFLPHIVFFVETYVLGKANKVPFIYYVSTIIAQKDFFFNITF